MSLSKEEILSLRSAHMGPSLSIAYRDAPSGPIFVVRGRKQFLYDEQGRAFLDCVNNVCHVGHCHPAVVEAASTQLATLNTNTRYLHPNIVNYASELASTLPEPLRVCFFVNSGSEANDLALRLARAFTNQRDVICVQGGYHGNLISCIDISPYKFDGPGGRGPGEHAHPVPAPDTYRGPIRMSSHADPGAEYAKFVQERIESITAAGRGLCAFICESILSCAGQVVLPENYLRRVYHYVRASGGLCIADEVQVGMGRVGSHFWAFQTQGDDVVPDIVTVGKPIGNGFPLGVVVTTPQVARAFANGMEYFNTFGGNPVSCAVGRAVLQVIRTERLQENALRVGSIFLAALRELKDRHSLVGDVRGLGLFLGIELVHDRTTLEPAAAEAEWLANQMRERGVLISTDGPLHNVIKFKPPLCFTEEDVRVVCSNLDELLSQLEHSKPPLSDPSAN